MLHGSFARPEVAGYHILPLGRLHFLCRRLGGSADPGWQGYKFLLGIVVQAMRCESIFILSLLLFLMLAAGKLGLSYRSRVFGISFGFGIMAASDLVVSAAFLHFGRNIMTSTDQHLYDQRQPADADGLVRLLRAAGTGSSGGHADPPRRWRVGTKSLWRSVRAAAGSRLPIPFPQASDFFLQDVEKVVDRILIKNSLHVAS